MSEENEKLEDGKMSGNCIQNEEKFENLKSLIQEYYCLVQNHQDGLPPYATFAPYVKKVQDDKNRPEKIKELVDILANEQKKEDNKIEAISQLWATGGDIYVKDRDEPFKFEKIIHSISNKSRLQVCLKGSTDKKANGKVVGKALNKDNLLKFAKAIGEYIRSFEDEKGPLKDIQVEHDLINNDKFKDILNNNIDAAINELLFWYYYQEDKYPIINSRAKNSRKILNQALKDENISNDLNFNNECMNMKNFEKIEKDDSIYISKQLMLDQLFYSIDEMKSMKKIDEIYSYKNNEICKFYQKLWNTIKEAKIIGNAEFFNKLLEKSKNIILYGAPGTGKTYTSEENIKQILKQNPNSAIANERFVKVQFHPSYSYEDFMEGIKPVSNNNTVVLELKQGQFMNFCDKAKELENAYKDASDKEKMKYAYFFLVDEINRAELSRVFGEIMYALDKRGNEIETQYSYMHNPNKKFFIPENVYFIGTMNDVDRSIDSFDIALRRRFFWYRMDCDYSVVFNELEHQYSNIGEFGNKNIPDSGYLKACYELNKYITDKSDDNLGLGKLYELGHSYFLNIKVHEKGEKVDNKHLKSLFDFSIEPLLKEYLRAEYSEEQIEGKIVEAKKRFQIDNTNS